MVNEKRLIDANALIAEVQKTAEIIKKCGARFSLRNLITCIRIAPTVEAVEVVHGRWDDDGRCTNCGKYMPFDCEGNAYESIYCPDCGAEMNLR